MTKIKNTKKGMAKKTLSMSLVVAMLATSNVPVWAAEFSDGTDATVTSEAPVIDDTTADVAEEIFTDEAAPEVATEETVAPATADNTTTNTEGYTSNLKVKVGAWGSAVTVTGGLKDAAGNEVKTSANASSTDAITASYIWLADGIEAAGSGVSGDLGADKSVKAAADGILAYTPDKKDFNKTLSLMVTVKRAGTIIYQSTIEGGKVAAKDISSELKTSTNNTLAGIGNISYNGEDQKLVPTDNFTGLASGVTKDCIAWNYSTNGNDFTNVTGENITVVGTVKGTEDPTSPAYGYTGETASATYQITKFAITDSNRAQKVEATMNTESVQYTGTAQKFGKSDVKLGVKINDTTTIDISGAIKDDAEFTGDTNVFEDGYQLVIPKNQLDKNSDILKNFDITNVTSSIATTTNRYKIVARDLSKCTGEVNAALNVDDLKDKTPAEVSAAIAGIGDQIILKGEDGKTFTLRNISSSVNVTVEPALTTAVANGTTGLVDKAFTISYLAGGNNVTGTITLPIRLTTRNFNNIGIKVNSAGLATTAAGATSLATYDGTAKQVEKMTGFGLYTGNNLSVAAGLKSNEYSISYDDNVNAGTVKVTLTGHGSYEGCVKNFYFKISPATVATGDITIKDVAINPDNDTDASLYKTASKFKIEKELVSGKAKTTLEEGKDYTVNFYYVPSSFSITSTTTEKNIKAAAGDNAVGSKLVAAVTFKKGNYSDDGKTFLAKAANITKKSISEVTITLDKSSYTYTGKEIIPDLVVKDGSSVLTLNDDYTLKVKDNKNVGTATVTVVPKAGSDYATDSSASATFEITPANAEDVVVTLASVADNTMNYTGKQLKPSVASITLNGVPVTGEFNTSRLVYGENVQAGKEAGSVTISLKSGNKNFTGTKTHKFNIKGIALTGTLKVYDSNKKSYTTSNKVVQSTGSGAFYFRYSGNELKFANAAFTPDKAGLKEGTDYEIKYINNVDAGYGYVVAVAKGNYEGNLNGTLKDGSTTIATATNGKLVEGKKVLATNVIDAIGFKIMSNVFTASDITVTNGVYASGLAVKPQVTVTVAGKTLVEGKDYKLNIRPQSADDDFTYPDSVINATNGKIFYVDVVAMGGYTFDNVAGGNTFAWGIDKFDFAAANVTSSGDTVTVKNGNMTVDPSDYTVTKDETAGTVTVAAKEGSKNYTGSQTVKMNNVQIQAPVISSVKVVGNKATVILSGESDGASGYDYVISKANDYSTERVDVTKNQIKTTGDFKYVQQGTYYAYCHAWTRDANGKKVFSGWSNIYPFSVTAITPDAPVITNVKVSGSTIKVTYKASANATGYDVVLGTSSKKENGETRPYHYGAYKVLNLKEGTVTATFKKVPKGTWTVGMHAFNRTSEDGKKVFSKWSNLKKATVK